MSVLSQIQVATDRQGLRFILIGGFAVIEHGYARLTADLDLLIPRADEAAWQALLTALGFKLAHRSDNFQQYQPSQTGDWPVDLMLVGPDTFPALMAAASRVTVQAASVLLVSLEHLLALKLHVLKQAPLHRFLKDFQDVVELVRVNKVDLRSTNMRALFLKQGSSDLYEKIQRALE